MSSSNIRSTRSGKESAAPVVQKTSQRRPPTRSGDKTAAPGRRITATLDAADQLLFDLKEAGHGNIEIAQQLLSIHGLSYEAKTVGTRYRRIKQAKETKAATENQGHQWTAQEDDALKKAQDFATEKIREGIRRAESQRWQHVQNYMEDKHNNANIFLQPACRERWAQLVAVGSALPVPQAVLNSGTAMTTFSSMPYFPIQPLAGDYQQVYYPNEPVDLVAAFHNAQAAINPAAELPSFANTLTNELIGDINRQDVAATGHLPSSQPSHFASVDDNSHLGGSPPKPQHTAYPDPLVALATPPQAYYSPIDSHPTGAYGFPHPAEGATTQGLPSPPSPVAVRQTVEASMESVDPEILDAEGSDAEVVAVVVGSGAEDEGSAQPKAAVQGAARSLRSQSQLAPSQELADPRQKLTVPELKVLCAGRGISSGGLKGALLAHLAADEEGKTDEELRSLLSAKQLSAAGSRSDLLSRARRLDVAPSKWSVKHPSQMVPTPAGKRAREDDEEDDSEDEEPAKRFHLNPNLKRSYDLVDGEGNGLASPTKRPRLEPAITAAVPQPTLPSSGAGSLLPQTPIQGVAQGGDAVWTTPTFDISAELRAIDQQYGDQTVASIDWLASPWAPHDTSTPGGGN